MTPEVCPNCGAEVPAGARVCPECGADETTGWSETAGNEALGIPDDNFDYNDFVRREFGGEKVKPRGLHWMWWVTALLLLVAFAIYGLL
ncbi:MAG TPA: zinc-ribbon domain-containing protein [Dongiaceae bacterium]|nr:zinc-ribbon domain-containing protein [Dongiaceae bacterium]